MVRRLTTHSCRFELPGANSCYGFSLPGWCNVRAELSYRNKLARARLTSALSKSKKFALLLLVLF